MAKVVYFHQCLSKCQGQDRRQTLVWKMNFRESLLRSLFWIHNTPPPGKGSSRWCVMEFSRWPAFGCIQTRQLPADWLRTHWPGWQMTHLTWNRCPSIYSMCDFGHLNRFLCNGDTKVTDLVGALLRLRAVPEIDCPTWFLASK